VPYREDKHENDKIKEKGNNPADGNIPEKRATPGRRGSAVPCSTLG
jgi:hypothetical protein